MGTYQSSEGDAPTISRIMDCGSFNRIKIFYIFLNVFSKTCIQCDHTFFIKQLKRKIVAGDLKMMLTNYIFLLFLNQTQNIETENMQIGADFPSGGVRILGKGAVSPPGQMISSPRQNTQLVSRGFVREEDRVKFRSNRDPVVWLNAQTT